MEVVDTRARTNKMKSLAQPSPSPSRFVFAFMRVNLRDVYVVWLRHLEVYLRLWKMELAAPLLEPIFSLFAFGWGVGSLIASRVAGVPYLAFVGAGVLGFSVLMRAMFETAYGSYFRMVYQATFDAILATPIEVESLAAAEIVWAATKALFDSLIILCVLAVFGAAQSPLAVFVSVPLLAGSFFIAALTLGVTAHVHDIDSYNLYNALFFSVIFLCGVWFPVDALPAPLRAIAWFVPLTSAVDVTRALLTGQLKLQHLWEMLYVCLAAFVAAEWALRSLRRRMVA